MQPIGYIHTRFPEKFGIPRQSGLVDTEGYIELIEPYKDINAIRDLEGFDYIWLLWECSETHGKWTPTVRPPKLGGNTRKSIFATRSPFHPNSIGLSCVRLLAVEPGGLIRVSGADILDGTPLIDIKPYIPYADSHPDAKAGWVDEVERTVIDVIYECDIASIPPEAVNTIRRLIYEDPRPGYQNDGRLYGMRYDIYDVHFEIRENTAYIKDVEIY